MDGPIDPLWVENLNSVLDDNKRLSLPNGETVKLNSTISIIIESDSLANVTPATISRCGLMYLPNDVSPLFTMSVSFLIPLRLFL